MHPHLRLGGLALIVACLAGVAGCRRPPAAEFSSPAIFASPQAQESLFVPNIEALLTGANAFAERVTQDSNAAPWRALQEAITRQLGFNPLTAPQLQAAGVAARATMLLFREPGEAAVVWVCEASRTEDFSRSLTAAVKRLDGASKITQSLPHGQTMISLSRSFGDDFAPVPVIHWTFFGSFAVVVTNAGYSRLIKIIERIQASGAAPQKLQPSLAQNVHWQAATQGSSANQLIFLAQPDQAPAWWARLGVDATGVTGELRLQRPANETFDRLCRTTGAAPEMPPVPLHAAVVVRSGTSPAALIEWMNTFTPAKNLWEPFQKGVEPALTSAHLPSLTALTPLLDGPADIAFYVAHWPRLGNSGRQGTLRSADASVLAGIEFTLVAHVSRPAALRALLPPRRQAPNAAAPLTPVGCQGRDCGLSQHPLQSHRYPPSATTQSQKAASSPVAWGVDGARFLFALGHGRLQPLILSLTQAPHTEGGVADPRSQVSRDTSPTPLLAILRPALLARSLETPTEPATGAQPTRLPSALSAVRDALDRMGEVWLTSSCEPTSVRFQLTQRMP